jgi:hypothetical protein
VRELRSKFVTISDPRWTPDDKYIVVIGREFDGKFGYYRVDVETGKPTAIINYPSPGNRMGPMGPEGSFSKEGEKFYIRRYRYTTPRGPDLEAFLVEIDVQTGEERVLSRQPPPDEIPAALSVDFKTMYFRRAAESGGNVHVIVARDLASGSEREIFRSAGITSVNRSPDGKWLGLVVKEPANPSTVVLVPTAGGDPVELWRAEGTRDVGTQQLLAQGAGAWANDSRSLITRTTAGNDQQELWWVSLDGRSRKLEELTGLVPAGLRFHPDGKRLMFGSRVAGASSQPAPPTEVWVWENLLQRARR